MRHLLALLCASIHCVYAEESLPYITPDGYNASLNGNIVEFTCLLDLPVNDVIHFVWFINGIRAGRIGEEVLAEQGIRYSDTLIEESNRTSAVISVETRGENHNINLSCLAVTYDSVPQESNEVVFRVQGLLDAPTALEISYFNSTHEELVWKDPYTLDLTDILHDIIGYTVTIIMSHPPPSYPYDLSVTLDHLPHTSNQTYIISHDGQVSFPRYTFPVWLSIRAENPVGLGATSPPLKYTPDTTTDDCIRLHDMVSPQSESEVIFTDTLSPSVKILLTELPSHQSGVDYCFDTVEMMVTETAGDSGDSGDGETHVLVPILSETGVSMILESDLDSDTHYEATLSFNSKPFTSTTFSTYAVQDVVIDVLSDGLTVECVFAEGSPETSCTVILVLYGVELRRETISGVMIFHDLDSGNYTVMVYDSDLVMEGSSDYGVPALERDVEVTGIPPTTSDTSSTDSATVTPEVTTEGAGREGESPDVSDRGDITGSTLWVVIGVVVLVVIILVGIVALAVGKRYCSGSSASYDVKNEENKLNRTCSASNPITEYDDEPHVIDEQISPYAETKAPPTTTAATGPGDDDVELSGVRDDPYEVMDLDKARERVREKKKQQKRTRVQSASLPEPTAAELKQIRSHTYSTVQKDKRKTKRPDSRPTTSPPPPPVPPQTFNYDEEFPSEVKIDLCTEHTQTHTTPGDSHVYDSLHPSSSKTESPCHHDQSAATKRSGDPVYASISGPPAVSSNPSSTSLSSPTDDRDDSRLITPSPPTLPARSPYHGRGKVVNSPPLPPSSTCHSGSRHSMIEDRAAEVEPLAVVQRPQSVYMTSDPEQSYLAGRKMSSLPLLSLEYDV